MSLVDKLETNLIDGDNNELWTQYRSHIFVAAGLMLLFFFLFSYWLIRSHTQETAARLEFAVAKTPEDRRNVVLKYIGTRQAAPDLLLVAEESLREGKLGEAEQLYTLFISTYKGHPLFNGARLGLAYTDEAAGKKDQAFAKFKDIGESNPPDAYTALALLEVARVYTVKGDLDAARRALGDCMNNTAPQSQLKELAAERLREITPVVAPKPAAAAPDATPAATGNTNAAPVAPVVPATNAAAAPLPAARPATNAAKPATPAVTNGAKPAPAPVVPSTPPTNASVTPPPAPASTNASNSSTPGQTAAGDGSGQDVSPAPAEGVYPYGIKTGTGGGRVYSPYAPDQGVIDVTGLASGTKARCPYTQKIFLVP